MSVWDSLVGQASAVATLRGAASAAAEGRAGRPVAPGAMTHSWLFTGPAGSGRSIAAQAFAAALQCESGTGCGECHGCRAVLRRAHADVFHVTPEGLSIGVKEMRELVRQAGRRPVEGRWQVVIIEDADRLTEQASNALLKFVEEPPEATVFLLCTPSLHPDDVLVTIQSRCRIVALRTPPADAVARVLVAEGIEASTAQWAAAAGQGHVGRARRLARDADVADRRAEVLTIPARLTSLQACLDAANSLVNAAEAEAAARSAELDAPETDALAVAMGAGGTGKGVAAMARGSAGVLKELEKRQKSRATRTQRDVLDRALVDLAGFYRDVLLVHAGSPVAPAHPDFAGDARAVAARVDAPATLQFLDAVLA